MPPSGNKWTLVMPHSGSVALHIQAGSERRQIAHGFDARQTDRRSHLDEASEVRWTGVIAGNLRTVQVDRLFRAGLNPLSTGNEAWWIIDYKTAHADISDPTAALPLLRATFAPQLEAYAAVLANLHGKNTTIRAGLYYPRMSLLDWWEF